jgi:hypothetical protein
VQLVREQWTAIVNWTLSQEVLQWRDGVIPAIAQQITRQHLDSGRKEQVRRNPVQRLEDSNLLVLADAIEEAGAEAALTDHMRHCDCPLGWFNPKVSSRAWPACLVVYGIVDALRPPRKKIKPDNVRLEDWAREIAAAREAGVIPTNPIMKGRGHIARLGLSSRFSQENDDFLREFLPNARVSKGGGPGSFGKYYTVYPRKTLEWIFGRIGLNAAHSIPV